jgi:hypothetical protein
MLSHRFGEVRESVQSLRCDSFFCLVFASHPAVVEVQETAINDPAAVPPGPRRRQEENVDNATIAAQRTAFVTLVKIRVS